MNDSIRVSSSLVNRRLREAYRNMRRRCYGKEEEHKSYRRNNIEVCERWLGEQGVENFMRDMGPSYEHGLTLDRIDPAANYSPENCRWIPKSMQAANRTNTVWVDVNGIPMCMKHALRELDREDEYPRILDLVRRCGMSFEDALCRKPQEYRQTETVFYHGKAYPSLNNLIRETGHYRRRQAIYKRIRQMGWSIERAIDTPIARRTKKALHKKEIKMEALPYVDDCQRPSCEPGTLRKRELDSVAAYMQEYVGAAWTNAVWFDRYDYGLRIERSDFYMHLDELVEQGFLTKDEHLYQWKGGES